MDYFLDPDLRRVYSGANPDSHQERGIHPGHYVLVYMESRLAEDIKDANVAILAAG